MIDQELLGDFVVEANEHLANIENQFLAIEEMAPEVDVDLVNQVFRAIHSIKGAAGFMGLVKVNELGHNLENVLNMLRNRELTPDSAIVDVMLRAADRLKSMIGEIESSNDVDVSSHVAELTAIAEGHAGDATEGAPAPIELPEMPATAKAALAPAAELDDAAFCAAPVIEEATSVATAPSLTPAPVAKPEVPITSTAAKTSPAEVAAPAAANTDQSIRVSVGVLDSLMNLAGELVLSRNQLLQAISRDERSGLEAISARVDQVTSELQEAIMQTRMQQIGSVFGRFPRVVRDLSTKLAKNIDLVIEGKEVEVDKTIVEAIGDPLTHLVRNSVDHGVELPAERVAKGKPAKGTITLRAFYQAGKVRIDITDDGGGIDPQRLKDKAVSQGILSPERAAQMSDRDAVRLIFAPGLSTAKEVTDISGRGVGMDVVRTNITKLGGTVDVDSTIGVGTSIIVTLPLTLAIIPSLIVQVGVERFAIPQVSIVELVRIREGERTSRLGRVKDAEVLRLRGQLLPLIRLQESLRCQAADKVEPGATNIIVVDSGQTRFGIVVDALHDSEEIVVKPLGRHFKDCSCLAGATILGDGHIALILDIAGIAVKQELRGDHKEEENEDVNTGGVAEEELQTVLLFENAPHDHFALPMDVIARIERVRTDQLDSVGGREVLQYRNSTLTLLRLNNFITAKPTLELDWVYVVVFNVRGREVGLIAPTLQDIREVAMEVDTATFKQPGVIGSLVIDEHTTRLIDLFELAEVAHPEWYADDQPIAVEEDYLPPLILLAEDSGFFRNQVQKLFEMQGYRVEPCEDGLIAWEKLVSGEYDFDVLVTDIEMPNMNGFELCTRLKANTRWKDLPVIALTSLAAAADMQRGIDAGIDDYQIKMDKDKLLNSLRNFVDHKKKKAPPKRSRALTSGGVQ